MFDQATVEMLMEGVVDTLYMTIVSTFFSYVFGIVMAVVLVICRKDGIRPNPVVYSVLDVVVNLTRSFPFLILMIAVIPFTRLVMGTAIGSKATIMPLTIAAFPYVARTVETALKEVDRGVIEAAQSMGASRMHIVLKVMIPESMPSLVSGAAIATTNILGYSAMAGAIGGGGLGALAINYGYYRYRTDILLVVIVVLVLLVQIIQLIGTRSSRLVDHRLK